MKESILVYSYYYPGEYWKFVVFVDGEQDAAVTGEIYRPESYFGHTIVIDGFCKTTYTEVIDGEVFRCSPESCYRSAMEHMTQHYRPDIVITRFYSL